MTARTRLALSVAVVAAAFALGFLVRGGGPATGAGHDHADHAADAAPTVWTCSMHPQIQLPEFGQCPICFMDLIPLEDGGGEGLGPRDLKLSASAAALAEIATAPVERRLAERELALVGKVTVDETRQRVITARVPGRLDRLVVAATGGEVARGEPLAEIYSPELYRARAELLAAREAVRRGDPGARVNLASAEERLRLWDLDPDRVAASGGDRVPITAPLAGTVVRKDAVEGAYVGTGQPLFAIADLSRVWVQLEAYERDLAWLAVGQDVTFTAVALPGEEFTGSVALIDPVLDERTRTVRVRVEAANPDGRLRPGMLARGVVAAELAADGRPAAGREIEAPLLVPASAPLLTGERAVVYVRRPGDEPVFTGVDVVLGPRAGDWYVVRDGLQEGDEVVVNGAFKLDSALQIVAATSMMLPGDQPALLLAPEVPACFGNFALPVVDAYLTLQAALAADDEAAAREAARAVRGSFSLHCIEAIPDLVAASAAVVDAPDLAGMRMALQPLSDLLWVMIEAVGWQGEQSLRRFHCPMAFDNAGAHWLQFDETTANPYYGAMMLRCGGEVAHLDGEGTTP
jgi:Cu(I)/Ag(I) efflux system membrane fusion protein